MLAGMLLACAVGSLGFAGCGGNEEPQWTTGLQIGKNGTVTSNIVEDFGKDFYTLETLQSMLNEEINAHNETRPEAVSLQDLELSEENGGVLVTLWYASCADYEDFNGTELFYGTPREAEAAGYGLDMTYTDGEGNPVELGRDEILAIKNAKLLIIRQSAQVSRVTLPGKILYVSGGNVLQGSRTVEMPGPEEAGDIEWQGELTYVITK